MVLALAILPGIAAAVLAATAPTSRRAWPRRSSIPIAPISPAERMLVPVLLVAELLSWGAAFTSLGLLLATWTPRIGRAIGISLAVFLLLSIGWMFLARGRHPADSAALDLVRFNLDGVSLIWIDQGLMALSPIAAPIATIQVLDIAYAGRWQFWVMASCWCLLACSAAGAMYVAVLGSFDHHLGRMSETSREPAPAEPLQLVPPTKCG